MSRLSPVFNNRVFTSGVFNSLARGPRGVESEFCLGFDGVNDRVIAANVNFGLNGGTKVSVSLWFKTSDSAGRLIHKQISDGWNTFALTIVSGQLDFTIANQSLGQFPAWRTTNTVHDGRWHHLVCTFAKASIGSSDAAIYLDGRPVATTHTLNGYTSGFALQETSNNLVFGDRPVTFTDPYAGLIDDVRIYSRVLTADEVSAMYNNVTAPPSDYVEAFEFEEGTLTQTVGRNGLVGTLTNGPTWQPQTPPRLIRNRETEDWSISVVSASSQYIATSVGNSLNGLTKATLSFWFKRSAINSVIMLNRATGSSLSRTLSVEIWSDGNIYLQPESNQYGTFACNDTAWHHLVLRFDGTATGNSQRLKAYLDGAEKTLAFSGSIGSITQAASGVYEIGRSLGIYSNGGLKDVRMFLGTALSAASVAKLARGVEPDEIADHEWPLNEGTGTTAVDIRGGANGTLTNGPTWSGDVPQHFRQAIVSMQAASFDGVDDYINAGQSASLDITGTALTVSAFANPDSVAATRGIAVKSGLGGTTNGNYGIRMAAGGSPAMILNGSNASGDASAGSLSSGSWKHVCGTYDGSTARIYVDGLQKNSGAFSASIVDTDVDFIVGGYFSTSFLWDGLLDEVQIHNRALSASEVADAAAGYLVTAGLVSRYKLDGNAQDSVGSNHGTEQGGVGYSASVPGTL